MKSILSRLAPLFLAGTLLASSHAASPFVVECLAVNAPDDPVVLLLYNPTVCLPGGIGGHEKITTDALTTLSVMLPTTKRVVFFTSESLRQIVRTNWLSDGAYLFRPEHHADAETFDLVQNNLIGARHEIVALLESSFQFTDEDARATLGVHLHTVQDFYAHSTWVEEKFPAIAPLGVTGATVPFAALPFANTCDFSDIILSAGLTSGYYHYLDLLEGVANDIYELHVGPLVVNKCQHGSSTRPSSDALGYGINKDS